MLPPSASIELGISILNAETIPAVAALLRKLRRLKPWDMQNLSMTGLRIQLERKQRYRL